MYGPGRGRWPHRVAYLAELTFAAEHGISQTLEEWDRLPAWVQEDVRIWMQCDYAYREREARRGATQPTQDLIAKELASRR